MKIVVMSDSHGDTETVKTVSSLSADATFHCGDSELSFDRSGFHTTCIKFVEIVISMKDFPPSYVESAGEKGFGGTWTRA